jgi:tetratricopeptide (TPR) repeat protein
MEANVTSVLPIAHDWAKEYAELSAREADLAPEDLERAAIAAHVLGNDEQAISLLDRAHRSYLAQGHADKAARCVFWLIFHLRNTGQNARAAGWIVRARRLLDEHDSDGHLSYLVLLGDGVALMQAGAVEEALPIVERAAEGAEAAGDDDLFVLAGLARGRCLDVQGRKAQALAALDEIMVYVVGDRVAPQVVGIAYCSVISLCMDRFDMQRAAEWTSALTRWCDAQSGLLPYRGECQVHRAEILQLHGSWTEAAEEVVQVSQRLPTASFVAGAAHYRLAELYRLRGQFDLAERSYAATASCGREVQPGLALGTRQQGSRAWTVRWQRAVAWRGGRCCLPRRSRLRWLQQASTPLGRHWVSLRRMLRRSRRHIWRLLLPMRPVGYGSPMMTHRPLCRCSGELGLYGKRSMRRTRQRVPGFRSARRAGH